jgi:hypothetical protein
MGECNLFSGPSGKLYRLLPIFGGNFACTWLSSLFLVESVANACPYKRRHRIGSVHPVDMHRTNDHTSNTYEPVSIALSQRGHG